MPYAAGMGDDPHVEGRVLKWAGGVLAAGAAIGMGAYFAAVGLDKANEVAGVLGAFTGLAGIALAIYGIVAGGTSGKSPSDGDPAQAATDAVTNIISDSTIHGNVIQGRNVGPSNR